MQSSSNQSGLVNIFGQSQPGKSNQRKEKSLIADNRSMESNDNNNCDSQESTKAQFFGVRSYIHHFYEPVPDGFKSDCSDDSDDSRYLIAPKKSRKAPKIWKFAFWFGFLLLLVGSFILIFAYACPRRQVIIGREEEMEIIDPLAIEFNKRLDWGKILGLAVFCIGGSLLALTLLLPSLVGVSCLEDDDDDNDDITPFKVSIPERVNSEFQSGDDLESRIPATEKVTSVQPSREEDESVVTESGLTKMK